MALIILQSRSVIRKPISADEFWRRLQTNFEQEVMIDYGPMRLKIMDDSYIIFPVKPFVHRKWVEAKLSCKEIDRNSCEIELNFSAINLVQYGLILGYVFVFLDCLFGDLFALDRIDGTISYRPFLKIIPIISFHLFAIFFYSIRVGEIEEYIKNF